MKSKNYPLISSRMLTCVSFAIEWEYGQRLGKLQNPMGSGFMATHIILLVEDNEDIAFLIKRTIENAGYDVLWAQNGAEALAYLEPLEKIDQPCLIICDLAMPVMDGWEFLERFSRKHKLVTIPLVIHSGEDGKRPTGYSFVKKPIGLKVLLEIVEEHCGPAGCTA